MTGTLGFGVFLFIDGETPTFTGFVFTQPYIFWCDSFECFGNICTSTQTDQKEYKSTRKQEQNLVSFSYFHLPLLH